MCFFFLLRYFLSLSVLVTPFSATSSSTPPPPPPIPKRLTSLSTHQATLADVLPSPSPVPKKIVFGERQNFLFLHIPQLSFYTPDCKLQNYANNYKNCFTVRFTTPSRPVYISHGIWMDAFRTECSSPSFPRGFFCFFLFFFLIFFYFFAAALLVLSSCVDRKFYYWLRNDCRYAYALHNQIL